MVSRHTPPSGKKKVILTAIASVQLPSPTVTPPETRDSGHERPSARLPLLGQAGRKPPCITVRISIYTKCELSKTFKNGLVP
jgi:hypothetical protein